MQGYIFKPFPPMGGGGIFVQIENREEFEGELHEKGREKERKEEKIKDKSNKHTLKCLYEA